MDDRTVANELQNGSTQSSLACKSCRRKKLKCDRSIPQCRNCQKVSRTCEYPAVAHKPGPRPGTHRRSGGAHRPAARPHSRSSSHASPAQDTSSHPDFGIESDTYSAFNLTQDIYGNNNVQSRPGTLRSPMTCQSTASPAFSTACEQLRISEEGCLQMIETYFNNIVTFSLFHQPSFLTKLYNIQSVKEISALLNTIFAFAVRFAEHGKYMAGEDCHPQTLLQRAHEFSQSCIIEYGDSPPPLHLLQALTLQVLLFSVVGVRGRTWRLAGQAIRLAYELRLHELDLAQPGEAFSTNNEMTIQSESVQHWVVTEEKRRVWWALFELDVFCSTIQRLPNSVDWTRNRTNLPSCDEAWFEGRPARSCHLQVDPTRRWRDLRDSGNTSPVAWFLLINSYKWESLAISHRIAPPTTFFSPKETQLKTQYSAMDYKSVLSRKRETLENCLRCALTAVPETLQVSGGFISFNGSRNTLPSFNIGRDHGRYMIAIMGQITQLYLARKDIDGGNFIAYPADLNQKPNIDSDDDNLPDPQKLAGSESKRWQRCLLIADAMAEVVRSASPDHYKFVSPNIATALWMGAATQLAVLAYHPDEIDIELATSNLDLLTTTIESFIRFWDVPETLLQSLKTLETRLKSFHSRSNSTIGHGNIDVPLQMMPGMGGQTRTNPNTTITGGLDPTQPPLTDVPDLTNSEATLDLSPFDVLQAMDFGAMFNGVDNWENLFLDPGYQFTDWDFMT